MKWLALTGRRRLYGPASGSTVSTTGGGATVHKPYYSLSQAIKQKVKNAVSYISDFEQVLASVARERLCQGVICGTYPSPDDRMIGSIRYLNSGDWVETLSA